MEYQISSKQGVRIRLLLSDCEGEALAAESVASIKYTIYEKYLGAWSPVAGHTNVAVATSSVFYPPVEDEHSEQDYNFSHTISMQSAYPFPERGRTYVVEYEFRDVNGEAFIPTEADGSPMFVFTTY